jgi:predicted Zn-dependent protease
MIALLLVSCGGGGAKQQRKQVLLSTEFDDAQVGEESARSMAAEMGVIDDPELNAYVEAIGRRMIPFAPRRNFDYTFHIVDQAAPNAFALPGGYIYVSRGLLTLVNSEDELACVIGHEITHAAERHAAGRQEYMRRMNPLSMGYMRAGKVAAYGRDQERDADRGGQMIAARAGFDPLGMATFLQDMDAMERLTIGWSRLPNFFASHPTSPERAATAANRAQNLQWERRSPIAPTNDDFLRKLDGLVLGVNPREGIFVGNRFLHADMNFSLRFPDGWHLMNSSQAVGAIAPGGDAMVALRAAGSGDDPEAAARLFMEGELVQAKGKVTRVQRIQIGDYPAFRIETEMSAMKSGGSMTFLAYEGFIFRIDVLSAVSAASKFEGRGRAVVRSFRPLTAEELESFTITRLRVEPALRGENLYTFSERTGNALDIGTTAVLNDIFIDRVLSEGRLLKIGVSQPYRPQRAEPPPPREVEEHEPPEG